MDPSTSEPVNQAHRKDSGRGWFPIIFVSVLVLGAAVTWISAIKVQLLDVTDIPKTCNLAGLLSQSEFLELRSQYLNLTKVSTPHEDFNLSM